MMENKGKIVQVSGPVVDVEFADGNLPRIKDALYVMNNGKKCVMEVSQHIGDNVVRCIMLAASEGLCRDMEVTATGSGIQVPVGEQTLADRLWSHLRKQGRIRHSDHCRIWRGTHEDRISDRLYVGRFGIPDRGVRGEGRTSKIV